MTAYLLIASRDSLESTDVPYFYGLARDLRRAGNDVTLFLVQNGVFAARANSPVEGVKALQSEGVRVVADDYSLAERGLKRLAAGVEVGPIEIVVDALAASHKVLWH